VIGAAVYQLCEFKSRRGRTKKNCQLKHLILALLDWFYRRTLYICT